MQKILAKMVRIAKEVGYIQKDKKNTQQGYTYLSEAAIKDKIQPLLAKHNVVFSIDVLKKQMQTIGETRNGASMFRTDIYLQYNFYDAESGEVLSGHTYGSGTDTADKGVYKAITGAIKYALTSSFLVPTGDDTEGDKEEHKTKAKVDGVPATAKQIGFIKGLLDELGKERTEKTDEYLAGLDQATASNMIRKLTTEKEQLEKQPVDDNLTEWINEEMKEVD